MAKYLHTINGNPAKFDGFQICYAVFYGPANKMRDSLKEIREDQEATIKHSLSKGFSVDGLFTVTLGLNNSSAHD